MSIKETIQRNFNIITSKQAACGCTLTGCDYILIIATLQQFAETNEAKQLLDELSLCNYKQIQHFMATGDLPKDETPGYFKVKIGHLIESKINIYKQEYYKSQSVADFAMMRAYEDCLTMVKGL